MAGLKRRLCVLGATGHVGAATLSIVRDHPDLYAVETLAAGRNVDAMASLCREFSPARAIMADADAAEKLSAALAGEGIAADGGAAAMNEAVAAPDSDTVVAAIAGAAGVEATLAAAASGKRLLLANKEALIIAGTLMTDAVDAGGGELLPVDSEHCALYELLAGDRNYRKLWLTASGGAVRDLPVDALAEVTPAQALRHPSWRMGKKITVDSATMMNKVLEIFEAAILFRAAADAIGVVLHPQSLYHALVEYADGGMTAHVSMPDMRLPIARMLAWPARLPGVAPTPDWRALSAAEFSPPDERRYPCLALGRQALAAGGGAPTALSAANEVAVEAFLAGRLRFTDIGYVNASVLNQLPTTAAPATMALEDLWAIDGEARRRAAECIGKRSC